MFLPVILLCSNTGMPPFCASINGSVKPNEMECRIDLEQRGVPKVTAENPGFYIADTLCLVIPTKA